MQAAILFCEEGVSVRASATEFGLNWRSLTKYLNGLLVRKRGGHQTFSPFEENVLEQFLHNAAKIGAPLNRRLSPKIVARIAAEMSLHTTVSKERLRGFRKRHPCLSERIHHATDRKKFREWNQTKCDKWITFLSHSTLRVGWRILRALKHWWNGLSVGSRYQQSICKERCEGGNQFYGSYWQGPYHRTGLWKCCRKNVESPHYV